MPSKGYSGITIHRALAKAVEQLITEHPELGYKSVADFTAEALRLRISQVKRETVPQPKERPPRPQR